MKQSRPKISICLLLTVAVAACDDAAQVTAPVVADSAAMEGPFEDVTSETGLEFHHYPGATGAYYFMEPVGSGVGLLDFDLDGDLDVYLVQAGSVPGADQGDPVMTLPSGYLPANRLYENRIRPEGVLKFVDITGQAGVGDDGYGMGVAVGDVDNDGDPDLYVTNFGKNVFYRNNGDGTFGDVTNIAGADDDRWNTSAAFLDYDRDGDLDLFLTAYVDFSIAGNKTCFTADGRRDYCSPASFEPTADRLFRNDGGWRFTDVTDAVGIGEAVGNGLGVTADDFDADGLTDIYVANDQSPNHLWLADGKGGFRDAGAMSGSAYNAEGKVEASMGVSAGDFDSDGDPDLFMTHLAGETNTLYRNDGSGYFMDVTDMMALGSPSRPFTGFGTAWFDLENDGDLDLFVANGAVTLVRSKAAESPYPYAQANQLFRNDGSGRFEDISGISGAAFALEEVSRGAAFGDIDDDGDVDIVVSNNYGPARVLLNRIADGTASITVTLSGVESPSDGAGARVGLEFPDGSTIWRRCGTDGSYLSAGDSRILFGLESRSAPTALRVHWSSGRAERFHLSPGTKNVTLREGAGEAVR
ncbi:MAG: CRTAC1 family protein [Gammaproteobacteria bacterium]